MNDEIIERKLNISKSGKTCMWVQTNRFTSPVNRYGFSSSICDTNGKLTNIIFTTNNYTRVRNLVEIQEGYILITASKSLYEKTIKLYKVNKIDNDSKIITLEKIATYTEDKWNNPNIAKQYKASIHSTLMRAKKYYNLMDVD